MMDQYLKEVVLAGKKPFSKEYRIIRKRDASTRWLFGHGEVQFDEDGNVLSMIGTIQDITERKSDEESLRSSEAKLNLALVSAEMGVWTLDIRENRRHFDDRVCQLLGIDKDTFGGSQEEFLRVVVPDDHAGIRISSQKTIQENRPYEVEYRVRWEDGSIHTVCARGRLTRDEAGRPLGILGILWDITEHKQDVEALQNIAQRLLLATTSANIGVWDWDFLSGSMTWDDRMFELYGASHGEIQGTVQDWKDALHPDDLERAISECEAAIRGEAPFGTEFRVKHRDGAIHWIKANALVLRDQHGKPVRMIGLNQDITEQRKAQDEVHCLNQSLEKRVQERTAQLEVANKELEAFSYSVSHDLRSPLRSIDGFSRVLTEDYQDKLDENGKHYLSRIQLGTQRMGHLIDDLLKLSKTSRHEMTVSECDLSRLCSQVVGDLADLNPERRIEVIIQPGMLVQADHRLIRVVLENLLGNAWKFTSKSEAPRIEVGEIVSSGGKRTFFIRDNGAGFDMAYADKLFNAFQRLHASSDFEGTGIGLAIVQRIIHRHGGRVWAEAKPDEGATFYFAIPD
jgi:PAS domain S-box-containing protein